MKNKYTDADEFAAAVQSHITEPTEILAGPWPSVVPGAMRHTCRDCGAYVSLSPATGFKMHNRFPLVPVICGGCFHRKAGA